jgi:hypothetical protein
VGKGDISIWYDKWLHNGRICDRISSVDEEDTHLHIMDVCSYDTWNFDIISTHLSQEIKMEMTSVFTNEDSDDIRIWEPFVSGTYSTKLAYSWLTLVYNPPQI